MKLTIAYPPLKKNHRVPLLSQNRQFQWFTSPTYIYPLIPATLATILKKAKHQVYWLDGIAENLTLNQFYQQLKTQAPDFIFIETKTPIIKSYWHIVDEIKTFLPNTKIVFFGDHVTALPQESFKNCQLDYIITGGHYDIVAPRLIKSIAKKQKLPNGIYYRQGKVIKHTGKFESTENLNKLPQIDRKLSKWHLYAYKNGNFKYTPGTYIMSGRDCWWRKNGGCKFCAWTILYPEFSCRSVKSVIKEINHLVKHYHVKEIMDDTGTFPNGDWLRQFCQEMIKTGLNKQVTLGCNLRFGYLKKKDYQLLAKANFRLLLFGLESANQETLDKLNKGTFINQIESELQVIKQVNQKSKSQLQPHLTCMIGYPWENYSQAKNTIHFCKSLSQKGLIASLQATIITPYPGTKLFNQLRKKNLLTSMDWSDYDMSKSVIKTALTDHQIKSLIRQTYSQALTPRLIYQTLTSIKNPKDIFSLLNQAIKFTSKFKDFN